MTLDNLIKKAGKEMAILALAGVLTAGLPGCASKNYGSNVPTIKTHNSFLCNYWLDDDQDGKMSSSEFKNIKDEFRSHEMITLVSRVHNKKGATVTLKVLNGAGRLITTYRTTIEFDKVIVWKRYKPFQLYREGGAGDYTFQTELNGNLIYVKKFKLIE